MDCARLQQVSMGEKKERERESDRADGWRCKCPLSLSLFFSLFQHHKVCSSFVCVSLLVFFLCSSSPFFSRSYIFFLLSIKTDICLKGGRRGVGVGIGWGGEAGGGAEKGGNLLRLAAFCVCMCIYLSMSLCICAPLSLSLCVFLSLSLAVCLAIRMICTYILPSLLVSPTGMLVRCTQTKMKKKKNNNNNNQKQVSLQLCAR